MKHSAAHPSLQVRHKSLGRRMLDHWQIYLLLLPAIVYFIIFYYWPMAGLQIAFRDYRVSKGIWGSTWVGLKYFQKFFNHPQCWKIIRNTMVLSLYTLATFPLSVIMALLINELRGKRFQKTVQMVTYAPHFISTVVICSMITLFMNQSTGLINNVIEMLGGNRVDFLGTAQYFPHIFVWSGVWQDLGWGTIIYLAAITNVNAELYEAAKVDGANRWQQCLHVTLPCIRSTIVVMLIMQLGKLMGGSFERIVALSNAKATEFTTTIPVLVYKWFQGNKFSESTALGLFQSVIGVILVILSDKIAKKLGEDGLL